MSLWVQLRVGILSTVPTAPFLEGVPFQDTGGSGSAWVDGAQECFI